MRLRRGIFVGAGLCALAVAASPGVAADESEHTGSGYVYVNDNTAGINTIGAFSRNADGTLTPLAGSPFEAGGAGTGTVVGSQGSLQVTADGRYLLAADAGSNQISVLRIRSDGTLPPEEGPLSPVVGLRLEAGDPLPCLPGECPRCRKFPSRCRVHRLPPR